jgi:hypothetical protein
MQFPGYLLYGLIMLGGLSWAEYHGYALSRVDQVKDVPKTVRDNPGAYRSHYGFYPRYVGGK